MELRPEQLARQLEAGTLHPAYLIAGPETLQVLEAADAVRAQARAQGFAEREVFEADGRSFDWSALESSLGAPSLFASRRIIEVRLPTAKPGKEGSAVLSAFCADPPPDVLLLVTGGEWSKKHAGKWSEAINRIGCVVIAWALRPDQLPAWIEQRLRSRGVSADRDAAQLLCDRVEGNLLAAAQEIEKLKLFCDGGQLDLETVQQAVADSARFDVFSLSDALLQGNAQHALRILQGLRGEGVEAPVILWAVSREVRSLYSMAQQTLLLRG